MQLEGATELELRLYHLCREVGGAIPAGDLETRIEVALSDASATLQDLRNTRQQLLDCLRGIMGGQLYGNVDGDAPRFERARLLLAALS